MMMKTKSKNEKLINRQLEMFTRNENSMTETIVESYVVHQLRIQSTENTSQSVRANTQTKKNHPQSKFES